MTPPLPEPCIYEGDDSPLYDEPKGYSADQLTEYGKACRYAALEEAAKVCEELNKFSGHSSKRPYPSDCAFAIRSLK